MNICKSDFKVIYHLTKDLNSRQYINFVEDIKNNNINNLEMEEIINKNGVDEVINTVNKLNKFSYQKKYDTNDIDLTSSYEPESNFVNNETSITESATSTANPDGVFINSLIGVTESATSSAIPSEILVNSETSITGSSSSTDISENKQEINFLASTSESEKELSSNDNSETLSSATSFNVNYDYVDQDIIGTETSVTSENYEEVNTSKNTKFNNIEELVSNLLESDVDSVEHKNINQKYLSHQNEVDSILNSL